MARPELRPGDRAQINVPREPEFHGRMVQIVGRAPTVRNHWKCIFLDTRPHPNLVYDFCFSDDELDPVRDRKRRPSRKDEMAEFVRWLTDRGYSLYERDPDALFYHGRPPLRAVKNFGEVAETFLREHGVD